MPERKRAYLDGQLVTIIDVKGKGRKADIEIRDGFGFLKTVKATELQEMDKDDKLVSYSFGDSE